MSDTALVEPAHSKSDLLSVRHTTSGVLVKNSPIIFAMKNAASAPSTEANDSTARFERTTRRILFELQENGDEFPEPSVRKTI